MAGRWERSKSKKHIGSILGVYENPFDNGYTHTVLNITEFDKNSESCIKLNLGTGYDHIILDEDQVKDLIKCLLEYKIC